jgi:hypothetical protein
MLYDRVWMLKSRGRICPVNVLEPTSTQDDEELSGPVKISKKLGGRGSQWVSRHPYIQRAARFCARDNHVALRQVFAQLAFGCAGGYCSHSEPTSDRAAECVRVQ